ncbi:MAG: GIY-YIG nuclease family protein [Planctomycetota bacterium]|jgi:hypothetical protein
MIIDINKSIKYWQKYNPVQLPRDSNLFNFFDTKDQFERIFNNKERIAIKNRWFDVISTSELVRKRNKSDGYYRVIYIQINWETGEYYIGKANRPKWSELKRYQGSGTKFKSKFKKHGNSFVRYYIARCDTKVETEKLEAEIVNQDLLNDEYCLNLVVGGAGTTNRPSIAQTSEKKREYMKNHPEQYKSMLKSAKKAFHSGDTPALRARSRRIKEVMSANKYREMSRERIIKWMIKNPKEYAEARKNNHEKIKTPEVQAKRKASFEKWVEKNPEEYKIWQDKLLKSRTSQKAREKRSKSLKKFNAENPKQAKANAKKRVKAAVAKTAKAVCMVDLQSGKVLKDSQVNMRQRNG